MRKIFYFVVLVVISFLLVQCEQEDLRYDVSGKHKGHEYVDLGLPSGLKWATCNVVVKKKSEYAGYFAWGETSENGSYDWSTYKYCDGSYTTLTKYCSKSNCGKDGFTDSKTVLDPEDDAAAVNWGGNWRMPTREEQDELCNNCTWDWTVQNGVEGYKVTGPNGNSIFLPMVGGCFEGSRPISGGGCYWSSSLDTDYPHLAYELVFTMDIVHNSACYLTGRCFGGSIRPVCP